MNKIKLHLGSGGKKIDGYKNIDIRYLPGVEEVANVRFLRSYKNGTVNTIYASHVLEHFGRWEYQAVLERWYEVLEEGGILRIAIPNFESICQWYLKTGDLSKIMGLLYGGQDYDENFHYVTFDFNSIERDLKRIGFKEVRIYDREKTEHSQIDDYSAAYLPHGDKNGLLMSLNIEAIK
jgi:predicted SAM-dependent methyltransferase